MKTPIEYLKLAWKTYTDRNYFAYFGKIMAVLTIISVGLSYLMAYAFPSDDLPIQNFDRKFVGLIFLALLSFVVSLWVNATTIVAVLSKPSGDIKKVLIQGFKKSWKYLAVTFVVGILTVVGLVLLVIPGLIFAVWFSFATLLVFDKGFGVRQALAESRKMVKGKFWKISGRFLVFGLFVVLAQILIGWLPYVGPALLGFTAPFFLLPFYFLYKDLSKI